MIKGITPTLAEGGKIKIGGLGPEVTSRKGKKFRPPLKFDHFIITGTSRDKNGDLNTDDNVMSAIKKDADGKVRAIPIVLHSDDIDEIFPTTYAMYAGKKLACRGDGETATVFQIGGKGKRTGNTETRNCTCDKLGIPYGCKPHGTLHCSLALDGQALAGAVHKWRTTSIISIQRMIGSLQQIKETCGTLRGLPLWLKLEAIKVSPPDVASSTVYCCHVELRARDLLDVQAQAMLVSQRRNALAGPDGGSAYRALIEPPAGDQETDKEQAEVAQEFHAEDQDGAGAAQIDILLASIAGAKDEAELLAVAEKIKTAGLSGDDAKRARTSYRKRFNYLQTPEPAHELGTGEVCESPEPEGDAASMPYDYGPPPMDDDESQDDTLGWDDQS